jgi:excinuclease ABC subunit B
MQIAGRAARNVNGKVILYADRLTGSIQRMVEETNRRRKKQVEYNRKHGITPQTVKKSKEQILKTTSVSDVRSQYGGRKKKKRKIQEILEMDDPVLTIATLEAKMKRAAQELDFETAAEYRDQIIAIKKKYGIE